MTSRDELLRIAEWHEASAQTEWLHRHEAIAFHTKAAAMLRKLAEQKPYTVWNGQAHFYNDLPLGTPLYAAPVASEQKPVAWMFVTRDKKQGRRNEFAAIDWSPDPDSSEEFVRKSPLYAAPVAVAEQKPVALVDLSTSEPRLAQLGFSLTHGQELYAAPLPADPKFVAEEMRAAPAQRDKCQFGRGGGCLLLQGEPEPAQPTLKHLLDTLGGSPDYSGPGIAPAQPAPAPWKRAPKHDRRIGHGDDFSGDAWVSQEEIVHYTAVGEGPPRESGDTR